MFVCIIAKGLTVSVWPPSGNNWINAVHQYYSQFFWSNKIIMLKGIIYYLL